MLGSSFIERRYLEKKAQEDIINRVNYCINNFELEENLHDNIKKVFSLDISFNISHDNLDYLITFSNEDNYTIFIDKVLQFLDIKYTLTNKKNNQITLEDKEFKKLEKSLDASEKRSSLDEALSSINAKHKTSSPNSYLANASASSIHSLFPTTERNLAETSNEYGIADDVSTKIKLDGGNSHIMQYGGILKEDKSQPSVSGNERF